MANTTILIVGDSQARTLMPALQRLIGAHSLEAEALTRLKQQMHAAPADVPVVRVGLSGGGRGAWVDLKYAQEWGDMGCDFWDQIAAKTQLWAGGVSAIVYNGGMAHKDLAYDPKQFTAWYANRTALAPAGGVPALRFYLSITAMQGQRDDWWYNREFEARDYQFRQRFKRAGWAVLEALAPTQTQGVDVTGASGGFDGFHYPLSPTWHMVGMFFINAVCNAQALKVAEPASVAAWYRAGNKTAACADLVWRCPAPFIPETSRAKNPLCNAPPLVGGGAVVRALG
jgi:hypothetical protein